MIAFDSSPTKRLKQLKALTESEKKDVLRQISQGVPIKPWPFGMPASVPPHVVLLGVSPGNSPLPEHRGIETEAKHGVPPKLGERQCGFCYKDTKRYWDKARDLCVFLVKRDAPNLSDEEALCLSAHLNLGTGQNGRAGLRAVEDPIITWVSSLLHSKFQAKLLVCFGLVGILPKKSKEWNCGGLQVEDWSKPKREDELWFPWGGKKYRFRFWKAKRKDGGDMGILMWPNHPSRHPFAGGPENKAWIKAKREADKFLKQHGF